MSHGKQITITLGEEQTLLDDRLATGEYGSASEIVRAGLQALDREERALADHMREKIRESLDDPRPSVPADEVFHRVLRRGGK